MTSILLAIIYIAFISLGLPDTILGSAWPIMYREFQAPVSYAGIISMIIAGGTILSSLYSDKLIRRFGTGIVTVISVGMTAIALLGFSFSSSVWMLCLWGIPYGLGAGSVDAALNNYVALHYKSRHMSWLHCFWGIGATLGPYIMGLCLSNGLTWNSGYQTIGTIQFVLVAGLVLTLPLWGKNSMVSSQSMEDAKALSLKDVIALPGAKEILSIFFCYSAVEAAAGLWASSYLVLYKGVTEQTAATWASLFYLGITGGRFLAGFLTEKFGDDKMIHLGQIIITLGIVCLLFPADNNLTLVGLILIGFGCAPIYPCLLHATPEHFGSDKSQSIMGMQMACAYVGSTFMPPLFGLIAEHGYIGIYPVFLLLFIVVMFILGKKSKHIFKRN